MIELWYTPFGLAALPPMVLAGYLARLPPAWQQRVLACRRPARQQATLFGALLLQHALSAQAEPQLLEHVQRTPDNRPYLPGSEIDFNLAHSGGYVACALSTTCRVGLDMEYRAPKSIRAFRPHFRSAEWAAIMAPRTDTLQQFYNLWTQKEAVAKADGRGLNIPLREIQIQHRQALLAGTHWHVREVWLPEAAAYTLHVASSQPEALTPLRQVSFPILSSNPTDHYPLISYRSA
ncbi:4'-phosphopantetheinyl transferase superfamily protein [Hymenobacter sp. NST-14]|uniref:4'-phosphopantetheinyl transferase family protein n=1 Tax=Hymenobacter piscis TaxID=2839984 RepID=UPI001C029807|nr:4'-phosphopantetheinyl transferase superfamily protein [Hymenobacter piscis]MBT9393138.1 4'-phosphopantetheinyl transferase superfamily protein [Hymenobacter piscis]